MGDPQARRRDVRVAAAAVRPVRNPTGPSVPVRPDPLGAATGAAGVRDPFVAGGADGPRWPPAACAGMGDSPFFAPDHGERADTRARRVGRAKAICATCAALLQCRAFALRSGQDFGVWGGLSEEELRSLRRQARRGGNTIGTDARRLTTNPSSDAPAATIAVRIADRRRAGRRSRGAERTLRARK